MAEQSLLFDDFNNYPTSCPPEEMLQHLKEEATAVNISKPVNETTEQRTQRMHQQFVEKQKVKENKEIYQAAQQHPDLANKLYNIREACQNDTPPTEAILKADENNTPYLQLYKKMDGGLFDFAIHDGKVVFNSAMDDAHMAEALDFLYRRGITNFELPQGVDKNFAETFKRKQEERLQNPENQNAAPANNRTAEPATNTPEEQTESLAAAPANNNNNLATGSVASTTFDENAIKENTVNGNKKEDKTSRKALIEDFEKWLGDDNQKKKKGLSFFTKEHIFNDDVEFSIYNTEDKNNYKNDGKKDKNGVVKETCAYRVKLKIKEDKLQGVEFHVPNDGKCPDALADKFAAMVKAQGATIMNFPEGLSPADAGVFRLACARAGIIPTGIPINEKHAQKMISEAENSLSEEDFAKFKLKLAKQMEINANGDPKARTAKKVQELKDEYNFSPLKDHFERSFCPTLKEKITGGKAEEAIGAANAMRDIHEIYAVSIANNLNFADLINSQLIDPQHPETKQKFLQSLKLHDMTPSPDTKIRDLNTQQMTALFNALTEQETKQAKETLLDKTNGLDKKDADSEVRKLLSDANGITGDIVSDFNGKNLKGLQIPNLRNLNFNNPNNSRQRNSNNNRRQNTGAEM